jgi:hypothetical protein
MDKFKDGCKIRNINQTTYVKFDDFYNLWKTYSEGMKSEHLI